jgi:hypothetical protein
VLFLGFRKETKKYINIPSIFSTTQIINEKIIDNKNYIIANQVKQKSILLLLLNLNKNILLEIKKQKQNKSNCKIKSKLKLFSNCFSFKIFTKDKVFDWLLDSGEKKSPPFPLTPLPPYVGMPNLGHN